MDRYVTAGTAWLNGAFGKVAKVGHVAGAKTKEKFQLAVSNLTAKVRNAHPLSLLCYVSKYLLDIKVTCKWTTRWILFDSVVSDQDFFCKYMINLEAKMDQSGGLWAFRKQP